MSGAEPALADGWDAGAAVAVVTEAGAAGDGIVDCDSEPAAAEGISEAGDGCCSACSGADAVARLVVAADAAAGAADEGPAEAVLSRWSFASAAGVDAG